MKIGERVPIATGVSSSTLTSSALTQTQFQYIDVGVNIEITPHVHANNDITLKVCWTFRRWIRETVGGVTQPVIGQRKIEHEIPPEGRRSQRACRNATGHGFGQLERLPAAVRRFRFCVTCSVRETRTGTRVRLCL